MLSTGLGIRLRSGLPPPPSRFTRQGTRLLRASRSGNKCSTPQESGQFAISGERTFRPLFGCVPALPRRLSTPRWIVRRVWPYYARAVSDARGECDEVQGVGPSDDLAHAQGPLLLVMSSPACRRSAIANLGLGPRPHAIMPSHVRIRDHVSVDHAILKWLPAKTPTVESCLDPRGIRRRPWPRVSPLGEEFDRQPGTHPGRRASAL